MIPVLLSGGVQVGNMIILPCFLFISGSYDSFLNCSVEQIFEKIM